MDIQVVLTKDDPKLGKRGEIVKVSSGFAQNFLFPHAKALPATPANLKAFQEQKARREKEAAEDRAAAEALTKKISGTYVTIQMLAGEDEKLFGSVTSQDIQTELQKMGISVDKKAIHIHEPIRKLGGHEAVIKPHVEFSAKLKIQVIRKK